jgi:hypothetical protein
METQHGRHPTEQALRWEAAMMISQVERSNYYKGLLVLAGRDRIIDPRERELMLQIGKILNFDKRFCEAALNDLLRNPHIKSEPVVFSDVLIAECFLHDAIRLAFVDQELHSREMAWLRSVGQANGLSNEWLDDAVLRYSEEKNKPDQSLLAIQQHL